MKLHTYHLYQKGYRVCAVKEGYSVCAMFFSWVWALFTKQWLLAAIIFFGQWAISSFLTFIVSHFYQVPASHLGLSYLFLSLFNFIFAHINHPNYDLAMITYQFISMTIFVILSLIYFRYGNFLHEWDLKKMKGYTMIKVVRAPTKNSALMQTNFIDQ